jgi:hypothetical protein
MAKQTETDVLRDRAVAAIDAKMQRRDELQAELNKLNQELEQFMGNGSGEAPKRRGRRPGVGKKISQTRADNKETLGDILAKHLKGGGVHTTDQLVEAVQKDGYKSNAKDFKAVVNQMLHKDARFTHASRGEWTLAKAGK